MPVARKMVVELTGTAESLNSAFRQSALEGKKWEKAMSSLTYVGKKLESAGKMLAIGITLPIVMAGKAAVKLAIDAVESENLFRESMGSMAGVARNWSEEISRSLGLSAYAVRKNVGTFNVMLEAMRFSDAEALEMSETFTELAYDMASFYNIDPTTAFDKLRSGLAGQVRPLRDLGINIDEATIKQWAYKNGLVAVGEELSYQNKVYARYRVILEQTGIAQGDLARTIDSPANKLRIMKSRVEDAAISFGSLLLPMVSKGADLIRRAADSFNDLSERAKGNVVNLVLLAAAAGPVLLVLSLLIKGVVVLGTAKRVLAGIIGRTLIPALVGEKVASEGTTVALLIQKKVTEALALASVSKGMPGILGLGKSAEVAAGSSFTLQKALSGLGSFLPKLGSAFRLLAGAVAVPLALLGAGFVSQARGEWESYAKMAVDKARESTQAILEAADAQGRATADVQGLAAALANQDTQWVDTTKYVTRLREQVELLSQALDFQELQWAEAGDEAVTQAARIARWWKLQGDIYAGKAEDELKRVATQREAERQAAEEAWDEYYQGVQDRMAAGSDEINILDKRWELLTLHLTDGSLAYAAAQTEHLRQEQAALDRQIIDLTATWKNLVAIKGADARETLAIESALIDAQMAAARLAGAIALTSEEIRKLAAEAEEAYAPLSDLFFRVIELAAEKGWEMSHWVEMRGGLMAGGAAGLTEEQKSGLWAAWKKTYSEVASTDPWLKSSFEANYGFKPPGLALGGDVTRSGVFDVGELGPERVFLPAGAAVSPTTAMSPSYGPFYITFNGRLDDTVKPRDIERTIVRAIQVATQNA